MTTPADPPFTELVAAVFEANARDSAYAHNWVIENLQAELAETRANYAALFQSIANVNLKVDSLRIERVLAEHEWRIR